MMRSATWIRGLAGTFVAMLLIAAPAMADHHGEATEAATEAAAAVDAAQADASETAGEAASAAEAGASDAAKEAVAELEKDAEAAAAAKAGAAGAGEDGAEATEERPKCSHPHWKYCESAGKCVLAWRCAAGTFAWPADNCECCARTAMSGGLVRCVQCLPKNCVFPQNCPDTGSALECRYEPPPVGMR